MKIFEVGYELVAAENEEQIREHLVPESECEIKEVSGCSYHERITEKHLENNGRLPVILESLRPDEGDDSKIIWSSPF